MQIHPQHQLDNSKKSMHCSKTQKFIFYWFLLFHQLEAQPGRGFVCSVCLALSSSSDLGNGALLTTFQKFQKLPGTPPLTTTPRHPTSVQSRCINSRFLPCKEVKTLPAESFSDGQILRQKGVFLVRLGGKNSRLWSSNLLEAAL